MKTENPFWHSSFKENFPKWIHIWLVSIALFCGLFFSLFYSSAFLQKNMNNTAIRAAGLVGSAAIIIVLFNRDTFLPFLSESFVPAVFLDLKERKPRVSEQVVNLHGLKPNCSVLYWAADPGKEISKDWKHGYGKFENSGIVKADAAGRAEIPIQCPARYIVHGYKVLPKHLHYRCYDADQQMLSRVETVTLYDKCGVNGN
jgi:hypothetical protein